MKEFEHNLKQFLNSDTFTDYKSRLKTLEQKRREFVKEFSIKRLPNLKIDEYVVGNKNETGDESFCYWIETKLIELGKIKGGTTADRKFGVYYGSRKNDPIRKYRTIKKWSTENDPFEAFEKIRVELVKLVDAGQKKSYKEIDANQISTMFKGKILASYFPKDYLTIFSEKHLDYFLQILPIEYDSSTIKSFTDKQKILLSFKNGHIIMKNWDNSVFSKFLYHSYNPRDSAFNVERHFNQTAEYIDFEYKSGQSRKSKGHGKKIDHVEKQNRNQEIGRLGEIIVMSEEIKKLKQLGRDDLAKKVKQVSLKDDSLGFDILSFNEEGKEIHIEVKATVSNPDKVDFYISDNEFQVAQKDDSYAIYLIYNVDTKYPKIHILDKTVLNPQNMTPVNYKVRLGVRLI